MSQAEELLNTLSDEGTEPGVEAVSTKPHIVIDSERYITVPDELKRIGVQHDHNIATVTFDCPRYWYGHDLTKMKIYVNYLTANNHLGQFLTKNLTVDESDDTIIHFDWTLTKNAAQAKGALTFLVCAKKVNAEGNEENHWNSELNSEMSISEGLEVAESIAEQYPDIITELLLRMEALEAVQPENVGTVISRIEDLEESVTKIADIEALLAEMEARLDELDVPAGATEEQIAQIQKNADDIAALPIEVAEDGYTDIEGLRQVTATTIVKTDNTITVTTTLEGGQTSESAITLDDDGRPATIVTDGVECAITWTGFDA